MCPAGARIEAVISADFVMGAPEDKAWLPRLATQFRHFLHGGADSTTRSRTGQLIRDEYNEGIVDVQGGGGRSMCALAGSSSPTFRPSVTDVVKKGIDIGLDYIGVLV